MQVVIKFKGGSLDGKQTIQCEYFVHHMNLNLDLEIYKLITVGQCKIPVRYKFIGFAKKVRLQ